MITYKAINRTSNSYLRAIKRATDDFGYLEGRLGCGYSHYYGDGFSAYSEKYKLADDIFVSIENLFEYGRPKIIQPDYHIYISDFFKIELNAIYPYKVYHQECDVMDEQGVMTKGKLESDDQTIKVKFRTIRFGLKNWGNSKIEIEKIANKLKAEPKKRLSSEIEFADEMINRWREAIKKQKLVVV